MSENQSEIDSPEKCTIPKPKIKHDWYQTEIHVIVTILLKNADKDKVKVRYGEKHLSISSNIPGSDSEYSLELDLSHVIVEDQCTFTVSPSKIEVKLKKRDGLRWENLEGDGSAPEIGIKPIPQAVLDASGPKEIKIYPSSCPLQKDWNKIEQDLTKEEEDNKPEGEDALKKLFESIYGKGTDEVKKAMNKSFMESGGTVLSTNWNEVSKEKVEVKAPEGMEFKKWES